MKLKPTLLALGAAAALGAASSAHALTYFGQGASGVTGTQVRVQPNGIGHALIMPYFNVQGDAEGGTETLFNISNSDSTNGKAVRLLIRGAANGDYLLASTVLLAPGDVWTAKIARGLHGPIMMSSDKSCGFTTLYQSGPSPDGLLNREYVVPYLSKEAEDTHEGEGYIEFVNMADIVPGATLDDVKSRNCTALWDKLTGDYAPVDQAAATAAGLEGSTGGISGIWYLINHANWTTYGGAMTAIRVEDDYGNNARSYVLFSSQIHGAIAGKVPSSWAGQFKYCPMGWSPCPLEVNRKGLSADALGVVGWKQVPDLSTPLIPAFDTPEKQVEAIADQMMRSAIVNDYVSDPNPTGAGAVPMLTDWVISHPLRRYYGAVDYGNSAGEAAIKYNEAISRRYSLTLVNSPDMGSVACQGGPNPAFSGPSQNGGSFIIYDREGIRTSDGQMGIGQNCGSVFTLGFAEKSPMHATVGRVVKTPPTAAGWMRWDIGAQPVTGFAAFSSRNLESKITYPVTWPHR